MVNAAFFHGAETRIVDTGIVPIRNDNLATVLLVGTSPQFFVDPELRSIHKPIEIVNRTQLVEFFGPDTEGFTITRYADALFDQLSSFGGAKLQIINVFDDESDKVSVLIEDEERTFDRNFIIVGGNIENLQVVESTYAGQTFVEGIDYTFDRVCSKLEIIPTGGISVGDDVELTYNRVTGGNQTLVAQDPYTFSINDTIQLPPGIKSTSGFNISDSSGTPVYVRDTDYSVDFTTGVVTRIPTGAISVQQNVVADYTFFDPLSVDSTQVIGTIEADGTRTGLQAAILGYNLYGYLPKILISPEFSYCNSLTAALEVEAENLDAMAVVDAPPGTDFNKAVTGRGPQGEINFNYSNPRLILQLTQFENTRQITGKLELEFKSARYAGLWCESIIQRGFWFSPSNIPYKGVQGFDQKIEHIPGRADTQANLVNSVGISTTINSFARGFVEWGNRSSAFPSDTSPRNFISIKFSEIAINEAIRIVAENNYVDRPINDDLINAILDTVNAYLRTLINAGGLIDGSRIFYDPNDNPPTSLANGQLIFTVEYLPPPPAERITFKSVININLLNNLNTGRQFLGV